jgi:hypothetical protein
MVGEWVICMRAPTEWRPYNAGGAKPAPISGGKAELYLIYFQGTAASMVTKVPLKAAVPQSASMV